MPLSAQPRLTSTIFVAEVREAPDVAQADEAASHGQHKVNLAGPLLPLRGLPLSLILRPCAWALPWGWLQDILVEVFETLQLLLGGHVLLAFCGGQNRVQRVSVRDTLCVLTQPGWPALSCCRLVCPLL